MKTTVAFRNVGQYGASWDAEIEPDEISIAKEARKTGRLNSRGVEAVDGIIYAGLRCVGSYTILPAQSSLTA